MEHLIHPPVPPPFHIFPQLLSYCNINILTLASIFFNMETRFKHHETPGLSQFYPTGAIGTIFGGAGRVRSDFVK